MAKDGHCSNRSIVNVDERLFSPYYDYEGDPGLAWSSLEFTDADAMCFFTGCGPQAYNEWAKAADRYIQNQLKPHYERTIKMANEVFAGGSAPVEVKDKLDQVGRFIQEWDESPEKKARYSGADNFRHSPFWFEGKIKEVVNYFDQAACLFRDLNIVIDEDLDRPGAVVSPPLREVEPPPKGGSWFGSVPDLNPDDGGDSGRSVGATAAGIFALGVAAYFGYKVLTE